MSVLTQGPLPVTAPLVLNPLVAKMAEAAGFGAGYLGGGATGYQKVVLEANLNVTEMCQAAITMDDALRRGEAYRKAGAAGSGLTLRDLGSLGFKIVADPQTPLLAAYAAWKRGYRDLAADFGAEATTKPDLGPIEKEMLVTIELEKLLAVERATVEKGRD